MIKLRVLIVSLLVLGLVEFNTAYGGLVITNTVASTSETATTATVTVNVFANPDVPSQAVNAFGLKLAVSGLVAAPTFSAVNASSGGWAATPGVFNRPTPIINADGVSFQGYKTIGIGGGGSGNNIFVTPLAGGQLVGTFTFTVAKTATLQNFSISSSIDTALGQLSFGGPVNPLPNKGFFLDTGTLDPVVPTDLTQIATGTIAAIVAVPEPSSLALVGVVGIGVYLVRRRRVA